MYKSNNGPYFAQKVGEEENENRHFSYSVSERDCDCVSAFGRAGTGAAWPPRGSNVTGRHWPGDTCRPTGSDATAHGSNNGSQDNSHHAGDRPTGSDATAHGSDNGSEHNPDEASDNGSQNNPRPNNGPLHPADDPGCNPLGRRRANPF